MPESTISAFSARGGLGAGAAITPAASSDILLITLAVSIVVHAVVLLITFAPPDAIVPKFESRLDVVLVNSKSATKPVKAPKPKTRTAKRALSAEIAEAGAALDRLYKAAQLIENTDAARWRRSLGVVFAAILQAADDAEAETATVEGETDE